MNDKLISKPASTPAVTEQVPALWKPIQAVIELLTGVAASEPKDWYLSAGHVLQRIRGGHLTTTLMNEINAYRDKGRIKEDYFRTEQGQACLQQVLNALDNDSPDEIRFNAMKALLLVIASESMSSRDDVLPYELTRLSRQLSSTEVLIMTACYKLYITGEWRADQENKRQLLPLILDKSGLKFAEFVRLHVPYLQNKYLVELLTEIGNVHLRFKLTGLGMHLCEFIEAYHSERTETRGGSA